jgi:hypothetical protein
MTLISSTRRHTILTEHALYNNLFFVYMDFYNPYIFINMFLHKISDLNVIYTYFLAVNDICFMWRCKLDRDNRFI